MSKILIVDGNNWAHRAYHSMNRMSYNGKGTGAIFGFLNILGSNLSKFKPDKVFVCWDDGRNKHRLKLLSTYKKREPKISFDDEDFHRQKDIIMGMCTSLGIPQLWYPKREADDFIYSLVKKYSPKHKIVIASGDKDFRQLVTKRVLINDENKGLITPLNFKKLFGINPEQYSTYLALCGDSSDKIPGIIGCGDKTALKIIYNNTLENFRQEMVFGIIYDRNIKLIDLKLFDDTYGPFKLRFLNKERKPIQNIKRFKKLCELSGINKFATQQYIDKIP